ESDDADGFDLYVQIWGPDGTQLFRSTRSALPPRAVLGFSDVEANGNRYRVYSLQTASQTVQIAQDLSARTARA
ncbi:MAG TPA: two-component sensor histidine kinase, partial [Polaromonas sp.]|nr:two-component sensor histidine kinase [Polaromonas sp.]